MVVSTPRPHPAPQTGYCRSLLLLLGSVPHLTENSKSYVYMVFIRNENYINDYYNDELFLHLYSFFLFLFLKNAFYFCNNAIYFLKNESLVHI